MHTGSLLARLDALRKCEESFSASDRAGLEPEPDQEETGFIEFKNTEAWQKAYEELKEVLAQREHLPGKKRRG